MKTILCFLTLTLAASAQVPKLEDFAVQEDWRGTPAAPKIASSRDKRYRTRVTEGAAKGPNFAGRFTIIQWGCGAGCISLAIADAKSGQLYDAPFSTLSFTANVLFEAKLNPFDDKFEPIQFRPNSRLLIARGCPEEKDCATYSYEWTGSAFRLVNKVPASR